MKYADDLGVPIELRVLSVLVREDHHICMHAWVERALCPPPEVMGGIVDT